MTHRHVPNVFYWDFGISVLGYLSHGNYCPSLCFPERKYIGVTANPETLSSELILFLHEIRTVLCRYLPVRLCINLQFIFLGLCHSVYSLWCVQCSRCEFQWRTAGGSNCWPSRWCEVVQLQLHCCPRSHHCGANQCQGRGQLPAHCLIQLQAGTAVSLFIPPCSPSALPLVNLSWFHTWRDFFFGNTGISLYIHMMCHSKGPPQSLNIGKMKE